jgi:hypothetical protein
LRILLLIPNTIRVIRIVLKRIYTFSIIFNEDRSSSAEKIEWRI